MVSGSVVVWTDAHCRVNVLLTAGESVPTFVVAHISPDRDDVAVHTQTTTDQTHCVQRFDPILLDTDGEEN